MDERKEQEEMKKKTLRGTVEAGGFRYPGLLSVVLGHLALLHELV